MRTVRGVVASTRRASLSKAASFAAGAAAAGEEDVAAYVRRFRAALDELIRLHRDVDPREGGEAENPSGGVEGKVGDVGARVLGSEEARRMTKKKKKKRKREEFDRERSDFYGDLGDVRREEKKKKKNEKEKDKR